jgi:pimeloyl-ACP methyl ester carboxylesterase
MKTYRFVSALLLTAILATLPALAVVPPPLPSAQQSYDAGSIHIDAYGTAGKPALVFIPGLTCGPWAWSGEINAFANDYRIYALTLPGFDGRAPINRPLFTTVSADFWKWMSQRNVIAPVVIGHSLGGTLAFMLAEQHPERLRAAVSVDGLPVFPGTEALTGAARETRAAQMSAPIAASKDQASFTQAMKQYSLPYLVTSKSDVNAIASLAGRSNPAATAAWTKEDAQLDLRPSLGKITIPFLLVAPYDAQIDAQYGAKSAADVVGYYQTLTSGTPKLKVVSIDNSRHFIMYDQPVALHAAIASFLGSLTAQ